MSSTITKATLTVVINESVKLNDKEYGARQEVKIKNINEISQRIVNVPTSQITLLQLSSSVGPGTYKTADLQYLRMTNLDNENFVRLSFSSGSANRFDVKLGALQSYIVTNASMSGSAQGDQFGSFVNFDTLKADASSAACDIELFLASK
jgi:hypothetical protein